MAEYTLNIGFTNEQLETIFATNSKVIVAKPPQGASPNVAWQAFDPLQANTLSWVENYGIYGSTVELVNGATLLQLSNVPVGASMDQLYTFEPSGVLSGPANGGSPNSFTVENLYNQKPFMTIGLFQDATVNGTNIAGNAISAAPVLLASTATITPYTTVYIWLQSEVKSNTVVTTIMSPLTEITFGGGVNSVSVNYNSANGMFD